MANHSNLSALFTDIANAIRSKKGTSSQIVADNFASEISSIDIGTDVSDTTATSSDVKSGEIFYDADGTRTEGTNTFNCDTSTDNVSQYGVLEGTRFHDKNGNLLYGKIPTFTLTKKYLTTFSDYVRITPETYNLEGGIISIDQSSAGYLTPSNIKKGVTILGVTGSLDNVKYGILTLSTSEQTVECGFIPKQVMVCVGAGRTTYFGFGINVEGEQKGSRLAGSSAASATSPADITFTSTGFKVRALSSSYALPTYYAAIG